MSVTRYKIAALFDVPEGTLRGHERRGILPELGTVHVGEYIERLMLVIDAKNHGASAQLLRREVAVGRGDDDDVRGAYGAFVSHRLAQEGVPCSARASSRLFHSRFVRISVSSLSGSCSWRRCQG